MSDGTSILNTTLRASHFSKQLWALPHEPPCPPQLLHVSLICSSAGPSVVLLYPTSVSSFFVVMNLNLHCSFMTILGIVMNHTDICLLYLHTICLGNVSMTVNEETSSSGFLACFLMTESEKKNTLPTYYFDKGSGNLEIYTISLNNFNVSRRNATPCV